MHTTRWWVSRVCCCSHSTLWSWWSGDRWDSGSSRSTWHVWLAKAHAGNLCWQTTCMRLYNRRCLLWDIPFLQLKKWTRHTDDVLGNAWSCTSAFACSGVFNWCLGVFTTFMYVPYGWNSHWFLGQAAPGTPQQLRCFHPGVDQDDQLYLPSTPGTHKSGAPPLSWIWILTYLQSAIRKINRHDVPGKPCTRLTLHQASLLIGDPMSGPRVALADEECHCLGSRERAWT